MSASRYPDLDRTALAAALEDARAGYAALAESGLALDLTRGKPAPAQLDLAGPLLTAVTADDYRSPGGVDVRNYGGLEGLPELRAIFGELLGIPADQLLAQGNSSLVLMHAVLGFSVLHGTADDGSGGWIREPQAPKMLCPVPGYDRHYTVAESLGFELIPVPLTDEGPDMAVVRQLVAADSSIKAMWAVPMYSNPTGITYSEPVVRELVSMTTAAPDFKILWDNAYALHHLGPDEPAPLDVLGLAEASGNPDRVHVFASTSKITHAGAGVAFYASSPANIRWYLHHAGQMSIGPDKINQLRHLRFFQDADGVRAHMRRHAGIIAPKFEAVLRTLDEGLGGLGIARWTRPAGGYFISLDVLPGTADRVIKLAAEAGIALTPAGAAFPHGLDPRDENIRIAPTLPDPQDVQKAVDGLVVCVRLAALEKLLAA